MYTIDDIDIFIITHNRADYLEKAIQSIIRQTEDIKKFYVLDNESTDNTEAVARRFTDDGCIYIKTFGKNGNFYKAQEMCSAKYVMTFHDDDLLHPEFFEKMVMLLNSEDNIAYLVSTFTWFPVSNMTPAVSKLLQKKLPSGYVKPVPLKNRCMILENSFDVVEMILRAETPPYPPINPCICSVIYRSDIFKNRIPMNDVYGKIDDIPLMISMAKYGKAVLYLDYNAVFHRMHPQRDGFNALSANTLEQCVNWVKAFTCELKGKGKDSLFHRLVYMISFLYPFIAKKSVFERAPTKKFINILVKQGEIPESAVKFYFEFNKEENKLERVTFEELPYPRCTRVKRLRIFTYGILANITVGKLKKKLKRKFINLSLKYY